LKDHEVMRTVAAAVVAHTSVATEMEENNRKVQVQAALEWIVTLNDDGHSSAMAKLGGARSYRVRAMEDVEGLEVVAVDESGNVCGEVHHLELEVNEWENHNPIMEVDCGDGHGFKIVQYLGKSHEDYCAYKLQTAGATLKATVYSPKEHKYSKHMLAREVVNTANLIQSPMPGTLISINVKPGQVC
jgi:acetyl/propionyl-CoA carboxylase alpha subunit